MKDQEENSKVPKMCMKCLPSLRRRLTASVLIFFRPSSVFRAQVQTLKSRFISNRKLILETQWVIKLNCKTIPLAWEGDVGNW